MEQLEDMHEFEKNAKRKAYFIKEGKRRIITKKTAYLIRGMSFLVLFMFYITKLILIININNNT